MASSAKEFLHSIALPTVSEFLNKTSDIRLGMLSCMTLFHLADYFDQENNPGKDSLKSVIEDLINNCSNFALIRDVANASKHAKLTREPPGGNRQITSSDQIQTSAGLFEAPFAEGVFLEAAEVFVVMDGNSVAAGGTKAPLAPAVQSVLAMWEAKLA